MIVEPSYLVAVLALAVIQVLLVVLLVLLVIVIIIKLLPLLPLLLLVLTKIPFVNILYVYIYIHPQLHCGCCLIRIAASFYCNSVPKLHGREIYSHKVISYM